MTKFSDIIPELSEIENKALHGLEIEIPQRQIGPDELLGEIERYLKDGNRRKIIRALPADIVRINRNLREFLDTAENRCDRVNIYRAYRSNTRVDAADCYSKAKSRFTRSNNPAMTERFKLTKAACKALREFGQHTDDTVACAKLFEGTSAEFRIIEMRDQTALLDAGYQLSDAWRLIADALNQECGLAGWFAYFKDEVDQTVVPIAALLGVEEIVDLGKLILSERSILPGSDKTFSPAYLEGFDCLNMGHHIYDLSPAPSVRLYSHRIWEGIGTIKDLGANVYKRRAGLVFWRDIMLAVLPDVDGEIGPYIVNRLRASLHDSEPYGRKLPLRNPFVRAFGFEKSTYVPLFLEANHVHKFLPDDEIPEDEGLLVGTSVRTQYAQIWGARPDVIPLFLRHHTDAKDRPIAPEMENAADRSMHQETFFPAGSLGAIMERATLVPDRGAGLGAMLRSDFQRKLSALWATIGRSHLPPLPSAFDRAWS